MGLYQPRDDFDDGRVATFWLPLPIGLPLFLIGVALSMKSSPSVRNKILQLARSHPKLARFLERFSKSKPLEEEAGRERSE